MPKCQKCKEENEPGWKFCSGCGDQNPKIKSETLNYKFVIMGYGGVGKSALTLRYMNNGFISSYDPTIEDLYYKYITREKSEIKLEILDTAGQEVFSSLREIYATAGDAFILVYSITSKVSFSQIPSFYESIMKIRAIDNPPVMIVGNKSDLGGIRKVDTDEGMHLARAMGTHFLETSAKDNVNVQLLFDVLVDVLLRKTPIVVKRQSTCILI